MCDLPGEPSVKLITIWWVEIVRERLTVNQQATHLFEKGRFNLRKINELEVRKQY
jgi:hypothetical protein